MEEAQRESDDQSQYSDVSKSFCQPEIEADEPGLKLPFPPFPGETVRHLGRSADGTIALSDFRIFIQAANGSVNLPLGLIESIEMRDIFYIFLMGKDAQTFKLTFLTNEQCIEWHKRLSSVMYPYSKVNRVFAFTFHNYLNNESSTAKVDHPFVNILTERSCADALDATDKEIHRMGFDLLNAWRVTNANSEYKLCPTYPKRLIVPAWITDQDLEVVASFRASRRIPVVTWRHKANGAVISRSSQPEVGWLGWRSNADEHLIHSIGSAASIVERSSRLSRSDSTLKSGGDDAGGERRRISESDAAFGAVATPEGSPYADADFLKDNPGGASGGSNGEQANQDKRVFILDARSYPSAVANRAKGGGCECHEYYTSSEIHFMGLANIHTVRKSFHSVRALCQTAPQDQGAWLSQLEKTQWLQGLCSIIKSAVIVASKVDEESKSVLVHCSDGWDRTPQVVALAQLLLDPFYRTIEGFQTLVTREWLDYGHKFADRCGSHGPGAHDQNERCPVFLQWLDCVYQVHVQFPCAFQFNETFLFKLALHTYSCLFGTFLCNSHHERESVCLADKTYSIWAFLKSGNNRFRNYLYNVYPKTLWPKSYLRHMVFWKGVYLNHSSKPLRDQPKVEVERQSESTVMLEMISPSSAKSISLSRAGSETGNESDQAAPDVPPSQHPLFNESLDEPVGPALPTKSLSYDDIVSALENQCSIDAESGAATTSSANSPPPRAGSFPNIASLDSAPATVAGKEESENTTPKTIEAATPCLETASQDVIVSASPEMVSAGAEAPEANDGLLVSSELKGTLEPGQDEEEKTKDSDNSPERLIPFIQADSAAISEGQTRPETIPMETLRVDRIESISAPTTSLGDVKEKSPVSSFSSLQIDELPSHTDLVEGSNGTHSVGDSRNGNLPLVTTCDVGTITDSTNSPFPFNTTHYDEQFRLQIGFTSSKKGSNLVPNWHPSEAKDLFDSDATEEVVNPYFPNKQKIRKKVRSRSPESSDRNSESSADFETVSNHINGYNPSPSALNCAYCSISKPVASFGPGSSCSHDLDIDGIPSHYDQIQAQLSSIDASHQTEIASLRSRLSQITAMFYQAKNAAIAAAQSACNGIGPRNLPLNEDSRCGELFGHEINGDEPSSVNGRASNAPSDVSWEHVDDDDAGMTLWVPDHTVTHCAGCQTQFWIARRKHHCRSCGKVFCHDCSGQVAPIPSQNLTNPERVCLPCYVRLTGNSSPSKDSMTDSCSTIHDLSNSVSSRLAVGNGCLPPNSVPANCSTANLDPDLSRGLIETAKKQIVSQN